MTKKPGLFLRSLLLAVPLALMSILAVWAAGTTTTVPTGVISGGTGATSISEMAKYTAYPAGINGLSAANVPSLIMLVISRDEQLFKKAYSDYTDLNGDGTLDTTYLDSFTYQGYFDPNICYSYNTSNTSNGYYQAAVQTIAAAAAASSPSSSSSSSAPASSSSSGGSTSSSASGYTTHTCAPSQTYWSGNFLNWLAMSRLDILRWTFYGGTRQVDTATQTVLERAELPTDVHAWAKVYSGSDIASFAPFSAATTFCNVSASSTNINDVTTDVLPGKWTAPTTTTSGVGTQPVIRTASGAWPRWASTQHMQCQNNGQGGAQAGDTPTGTITDYVARVNVCTNQTPAVAGGVPNESICVLENSGYYKPEGLLQKYSKGDALEKRFGLITGSMVQARGAGQLRRNIGALADNAAINAVKGTTAAPAYGQVGNANGPYPSCAAYTAAGGDGDEFASYDGTFCYKKSGASLTEGIIYTLDHLQIIGWRASSTTDNTSNNSGYMDYGGYPPITDGCAGTSGSGGHVRFSQMVTTPTMCPDYGNPVTYMYATALQYMQGVTLTGQDGTGVYAGTYTKQAGYLPNPTAVDPYGKDPANPSTTNYQRNEPCAACSIVVVSSGPNSFDSMTANLPAVTFAGTAGAGLTAASLTGTIGTNEELSGSYLLSTQYLGSASTTPTLTSSGDTTYGDTATCQAVAISSLATLAGICNGSPGQQGGYLLAGLSYGAWDASGTTPIRVPNSSTNPDLTGVTSKFQVKTFGISLADNLPTFSIPVGSGSATLAPSCLADQSSGSAYTSCYFIDLQVGVQSSSATSGTATNYGLPMAANGSTGSYTLVWEDSQFGNDHDQDAIQQLAYCVGTGCNTPSSYAGLSLDQTSCASGTTPITVGGTTLCYNVVSTFPSTKTGNNSYSCTAPAGDSVVPTTGATRNTTCSAYTGTPTAETSVTLSSSAVAICDPVILNGQFVAKAVNTIGNACNSNGTLTFTPGANDVVVRNQLLAYSSANVHLGYQISGATLASPTGPSTGTCSGTAVSPCSDGSSGSGNVFTEFAIGSNPTPNGTAASNGAAGYPFYSLLANSDPNSIPQVTHYTATGATPAATLQTPLWYAAKYGGYGGANPNGYLDKDTTSYLPTQPATPSNPMNQTDPTNYFFARDAGSLKSNLDADFQSITSVAANNFGNATTPSSSNDVQGNGLSYQVQYFMQRNGIDWTGDVLSLWTDSNGFQREGSVSSGVEVLSTTADYVVNGPDRSAGALYGAMAMYRCTVQPVPTPPATTFDPSTNSACTAVNPVNNPLQSVWDASTLLDVYYDPTTSAGASAIAALAVQRAYNADAGVGGAGYAQRYIFTYVPSAPDTATGNGTLTTGTQMDFVWNTGTCPTTAAPSSGFCGAVNADGTRTGNFGLLNEKSNVLAQELVNWVRGVESTDWRSRTYNPANSTTTTTTTGTNTNTNTNTNTTSSTPATYRLGDIINSSPLIVGTPAESYDTLYGSTSYASFRTNYANRRQMVYVGANDGMLHAFNGGFYMPAVSSSATGLPTVYRQLPVDTNPSTGVQELTTGDASVPLGNNWTLGQEVWAFVPSNLLPHLRWMADKSYTHVFYVDGSPVVSDVQLWANSGSAACTTGLPPSGSDIDTQGHVCGWGTVMVVPFHLGGGHIQVDTVGAGNAADTQTSESAYVILDITNPEKPPIVLGEITTGTHTLGAPTFVVHQESSGSSTSPPPPPNFLLAIGSGPADNGGPVGTVTSTTTTVKWCVGTGSANESKAVQAPCTTGSTLGVWIYDLGALVQSQSSTPVASFGANGTNTGGVAAPANSFAGDMIASDWNLNFSDEAIYFGVVTNPAMVTNGSVNPDASGATSPFTGGLYKIDLTSVTSATGPTNTYTWTDVTAPSAWTLKQVYQAGQPVTIRPTLALDTSGRPMVYFGTGRSYTENDDSFTSYQGTQQQYIYGVSDNSLLLGFPTACATMAPVSLFDANSVALGTSGALSLVSSGTFGQPTAGEVTGATLAQTSASSVASIVSLSNTLAAVNTNTSSATAGCYIYSGWQLGLAPGTLNATAGVASERVISSQVLYEQILLTPTYIPPSAATITLAESSACNPIPVPGTSNLYAQNYLTGTASLGMAGSFGTTGGVINSYVSLGSGVASSAVLHTGGGTVSAGLGLSGGDTIQSISAMNQPSNAEISWREPGNNQ